MDGWKLAPTISPNSTNNQLIWTRCSYFGVLRKKWFSSETITFARKKECRNFFLPPFLRTRLENESFPSSWREGTDANDLWWPHFVPISNLNNHQVAEWKTRKWFLFTNKLPIGTFAHSDFFGSIIDLLCSSPQSRLWIKASSQLQQKKSWNLELLNKGEEKRLG